MPNQNLTTEQTQFIMNRVKHTGIDALDIIPYTLSTDGLTATPVSTSAPQPVKVINTDGTDNSLTAGGVYGQKVHVVGDSDKYVRGNVAEGSPVSDPVYVGFRDGSGNVYGMRGDSTNGLDVDVTRLPALAAGTANIGDVDVASIAAGTNAIGNVGMTPRTSGGLLIKNCTAGDGSTALTNSAQAIKASAGQLFGWYIFNPNTVTVWIQIYNTAAASVTVGTTNPAMVFGVPAGSAANVVNPMGIEFTNAGFSAAAVMTTAGGNTAPTTAVDANFFYI